jgi:cell wall-associated NlpC family hydrolase
MDGDKFYFCAILMNLLNPSEKKAIMTCRIASYALIILIFASSCTGTKQTSSGSNGNAKVVNKNPKFLDDISVSPESRASTGRTKSTRANKEHQYDPHSSGIEHATPLQLKYAVLLNTDVEEINNQKMFQFIDDWYGTRYCLGGSTKTCIDCSGFVQTFFSVVYGASVPRTARDQYDLADKIPVHKLQQGDLLFFNTRGGVSHVGVYLMNNKFVHASTNNGVTISDLS